MAALFTNRTTNGASSGTATTADGCWIEIPNDSVFDGAIVSVEASSVDTAGKYSPCSFVSAFTSPGWIKLDLPSGTYVRAVVSGAGDATSVTVNLSPTA